MNDEMTKFLDREQGHNPELLKAREAMPEPSQVDYPTLRVRLLSPPKCSFLIDQFNPIELCNDEEFYRAEVGGQGIMFCVWRSRRDGKIYI